MIIKLFDIFQKQLIMKSFDNLKAFNEAKQEVSPFKCRQVFISKYLPQDFQKHKKSLTLKKRVRKLIGKRRRSLLSFYWQYKIWTATINCVAFIIYLYHSTQSEIIYYYLFSIKCV